MSPAPPTPSQEQWPWLPSGAGSAGCRESWRPPLSLQTECRAASPRAGPAPTTPLPQGHGRLEGASEHPNTHVAQDHRRAGVLPENKGATRARARTPEKSRVQPKPTGSRTSGAEGRDGGVQTPTDTQEGPRDPHLPGPERALTFTGLPGTPGILGACLCAPGRPGELAAQCVPEPSHPHPSPSTPPPPPTASVRPAWPSCSQSSPCPA